MFLPFFLKRLEAIMCEGSIVIISITPIVIVMYMLGTHALNKPEFMNTRSSLNQ